MMCQRIGFEPISTIGFGLYSVSSLNRVPKPPARITTGISLFSIFTYTNRALLVHYYSKSSVKFGFLGDGFMRGL